jgi:hypothetical protein
MTIIKPRVSGVVFDKIAEKLGFNVSFMVEA